MLQYLTWQSRNKHKKHQDWGLAWIGHLVMLQAYLDSKRDICSSRLEINEEPDHTAVARFEFDFKDKM